MMLRELRFLVYALAIPPLLGIGGCSDHFGKFGGGSPGKYSDLVHDYDNTMTKDQQKATITTLQSDQNRQQQDEIAKIKNEPVPQAGWTTSPPSKASD